MQVNMQVNALSVCRVRERDIQRVHVCFSLLRKNKKRRSRPKISPECSRPQETGRKTGHDGLTPILSPRLPPQQNETDSGSSGTQKTESANNNPTEPPRKTATR